jgi:uncharacterized protein (UPF0261 family)
MPTIAVLGTLDTKGVEIAFLAEQIRAHGCDVLLVDLGVLGSPAVEPDVSREAVAAAAGAQIDALASGGDRGQAVAAMTDGIAKVVPELHAEGRIQGVIGIGGTAGTTMATAAMRALPMGIPKVMISTVAGGDVSAFVAAKDITMVPSIVDVSGLNRISRQVITQGAAAVAAMAQAETPEAQDKPLIAASMFGNTTDCVEAARARLEDAGFEVLVFHATGTGGRTMESLIADGYIAGVLDVTTTELADELAGGVLSAGPNRLQAAAKAGIPAVVAEKYGDRLFYPHNPNVTLMRTTPEENVELGRRFAEALNASTGPTAVYLPLKGISVISAPGQPFHSPEADDALFSTIKENLRPDIPVYELDLNINDPAFAEAVTKKLLELMDQATTTS